MFKELMAIFGGDTPLKEVTDHFTRMLRLTQEMVLEASEIFWDGPGGEARRSAVYKTDVEVNKLQREIRRRITTHLSIHGSQDIPYGLLMMSLVKDVERIGDYAKNLLDFADVADLGTPSLADDRRVVELREISEKVETLVRESAQVFLESNAPRAQELVEEGRSVSKRCDELVVAVAESDFDADVAVKIAVGARLYKRIEGHHMNVLTGVIMPLHKLDYFDEDYLEDLANDEL